MLKLCVLRAGRHCNSAFCEAELQCTKSKVAFVSVHTASSRFANVYALVWPRLECFDTFTAACIPVGNTVNCLRKTLTCVWSHHARSCPSMQAGCLLQNHVEAMQNTSTMCLLLHSNFVCCIDSSSQSQNVYFIQKCHPHTGNLTSETSRDSKNAFQYQGDV